MNLKTVSLIAIVGLSGCAAQATKAVNAPVDAVNPVESYHVTQVLGDPRYVFCNTDDCIDHTPKVIEQSMPATPISSTLPPSEKTISQQVFKVHFEFAKYALNKTNKAEIENIKKYLAKNNQHKLKVVGKTDPIGSNSYNKHLAMLRAAQVKKSVSAKGISIEVSTDCCVAEGDYVEARSADVTVLVE